MPRTAYSPRVAHWMVCLVLLALPSICHAVTWDPFRPIDCTGIDQPAAGDCKGQIAVQD